jgi:SpoVK/Ycf46/Vps4 family AAA+-type ATPase
VNQIILSQIHQGDIAFFCEIPDTFIKTMELFRKIEPHRQAVCVFEDLDNIIEVYGEGEILNWLDGFYQVDQVINIATTNYPENLDRRLVSRPRRFDRIIKIEGPPAELRRAYLLKKLPDADQGEIQTWVERTDGLSLAALAELVISVYCLGEDFEETLQSLREMEENSPSSREYEHPNPMGFGAIRQTLNPNSIRLWKKE